MTTEPLPTGPDRDAIARRIVERWPETVVASTEGATFFSLDQSNWPNYATLVWTDAFDMGEPSKLSRPGVYRLNIGVGSESFQRLVGDAVEPDYTALDTLIPHPVYAKQHWVAILNPSDATFEKIAWPLLTEAHDRLVRVRERQDKARADGVNA
jgi:hypothetical protein